MDKPQKEILRHKQLVSDIFIFAVGSLGSKIILFLMVPLYTSYLSAKDYGTSDFVFTIAELLVPVVSLVIFDAVLRFGLSETRNKNDILKAGFVVISVGAFITIMLTSMLRFYAPLQEWRWYVCAYVVVTMMVSVEMNYLKIVDRNKAYALISIANVFILGISNVVLLATFGLGVRGYLLAALAGSCVSAALAFKVGRVKEALKVAKIDKTLLKEMITFSSPLVLNNVSWLAMQSSDKIMIESMVGISALGVYAVATKIPSFVNVIINVFSQAWGISSVKEYESSNNETFYAEVFRLFGFIVFGTTIVIMAVIKPFMRIYVSHGFFSAWRYIPLLLVSASFSAIASYFASLYGALKMSFNNMKTAVFAALINITLSCILIQQIGVWGVIIGRIVAYVLLAFIRMVDVLRYIKFDPKWKKYLLNCGIIVLQAILITLDFYILAVSVVFTLMFFINNMAEFRKIIVLLRKGLEKAWGYIYANGNKH